MMRQKKINTDRISIWWLGHDDWCVWIPPAIGHVSEVYDVDGETLMGPYGETYWATWEDAADFVQTFVREALDSGLTLVSN